MGKTGNNLATVGAQTMSVEQQRCFTIFVGLGVTRSIPKLYEIVKDSNITLRMLKRWSMTFKWYEMAKHTQGQIAAEVIKDSYSDIKKITEQDLATITLLKQRFHARALIDPNDPTLTPEQRARAIDPDLADFATLLKQEHMILADPAETDPNAPKVGASFGSSEEIFALLDHLVRRKHNLPPVAATYDDQPEIKHVN